MMKNREIHASWKGIAILFIILFVLETLIFVSLLYLGTSAINDEMELLGTFIVECRDICFDKNSNSYNYTEELKLCECYRDGEVFYQEKNK